MDNLPDPPPCPPRFKAYLVMLRDAIHTLRGIAGHAMQVSEHQGQGTVYGVDPVALNAATNPPTGGGGGGGGPGIPPPPSSGTWVLGAIDGVIQWIDTDTCS